MCMRAGIREIMIREPETYTGPSEHIFSRLIHTDYIV